MVGGLVSISPCIYVIRFYCNCCTLNNSNNDDDGQKVRNLLLFLLTPTHPVGQIQGPFQLSSKEEESFTSLQKIVQHGFFLHMFFKAILTG